MDFLYYLEVGELSVFVFIGCSSVGCVWELVMKIVLFVGGITKMKC